MHSHIGIFMLHTVLPTILEPIHLERSKQFSSLITEYQQQNSQFSQQLLRTTTISDYVADSLTFFPNIIPLLFTDEFLNTPLNLQSIKTSLQISVENCPDEQQLYLTLRTFRRLHQVRLIWCDLNKLATLKQTLFEITALADMHIQVALNWQHQRLAKRYGEPIGKHSGELQELIVIAMGKAGAGELNLSSDIDLIFAYHESGDTAAENGQKCLSNQEFFIKLGQALIQSLDKSTADGFVHRVDMRLRPYGQSGPLAMNFSSLENYYQDQGREWERYAMIKARAVTGRQTHIAELMAILRPFSYRKYVDYSVFESLREMKNLIKQETVRRNLNTNVKLGSGGIREVEFIAQAFQLIRGGQETELQQPNIFKVFDYLKGNGYLPSGAIDHLLAAYIFLRDSEHAIQGLNDEQSQTLPNDDLGQAKMSYAMGFQGWDKYLGVLAEHRENVSYHFAKIVAEEQDAISDNDLDLWQSIWHNHCEDEEESANSVSTQHLLQRLRDNNAVANMQAIGKQRLDKAMPLILKASWENDQPLLTLERLVPLIESILRRTSYLVLITENPQALAQLVRLCASSPWIAQSITETPLLLDELLHPVHLFNCADKQNMADDLAQRLLRIEENDLEEQMDALRHFAKAHKLQIAACEITGALPLMKVSDHLTWLAECVLETSMHLAFQQMVSKYGYPTNADSEAVLAPEFIILGYGKMGGLELSYDSDLDLVFLHNGLANKYTTGINGKREQENSVFYTRMGQRLIHIMNTTTRAGQLYEVDMRLRPSGASGMIVASVNGFYKYQTEEAWTWEHQALIRARVICGETALINKFSEIRAEILIKDQKPHNLKQEVREMRQKMRDNLGSQSVKKAQFQLKHDTGGIVDIEFIVQYLVLTHSAAHPTLLKWTDNVRILDNLASENILDTKQSEALKQAYMAYRSLAHRRALQNQKLLLSLSELDQAGLKSHIDTVSGLWDQIMNRAQ
jgi:glutamate-ammonia-ligase adenylyltransferase